MDPRHTLMAYLVIAAAAVMVMPYLLRDDDPDADKRRETIAGMTRAERERLERHLDQYLRLSSVQRDEVQALHAELLADAANNHGRANHSLQIFREWLQTLSPRERTELSEEHDPTSKARLVREIVDRHNNESLELRAGASLQRLGSIPSLTPADMERLLTSIAEEAEPRIDANELEGFDGLQRTLKVFELMGRKNEKLINLLTEERMQTLLKSLSNDSDRRMLEYLADNRPAPPQLGRIKLAITLLKNLEVTIQRELRRQELSSEDLQATFAELPAADQDELLELSPSEFRGELRHRSVDVTSSGQINRRDVERFLRPGKDFRSRRRDGTTSRSRASGKSQ
ncbi:MAG: hypothetical protein KDA86_14585 [Planctomycetaceae bacterium]|nr:hypothetical protein [Planctomycetaceae bacterium]